MEGNWEARKVLGTGSRWSIGDGSMVRIWNDNWIPLPTTFRPITPSNALDAEAKVSDLLLSRPRRWNIQQVNEIFWLFDANNILGIPLGSAAADKLIWHYTNHGEYTVCSA
ncbi:hypothetical protein Acr_08g0011040 [Actinidia rufa]|uniref:Uncharacterized protein n=1 Tax=Actinidia rufa TaxID=165716 RepID=A0A7J0F1Y2_9ERIC|nr:hypothetical protein Acr_08g0011040 [Actinidia rufa]